MQPRPLSTAELKHAEFLSGESAPRGKGMGFVNGRWQEITPGMMRVDCFEVDGELARLLAEEGGETGDDAANDAREHASPSRLSVPSLVPKSAAAPATAPAGYRFPLVDTGALGDLKKLLASICSEFKSAGNYAAVRDRFCAVSRELNRIALWAPAFRPQPTPRPPVAGKGGEDNLLHRDRVVIDLHWLWCRRASHVPDLAFLPYQDILDPEIDFDFVLASDYAAKKLKSDERATVHLGLSPETQWQLATIKSEEHALEHSRIFTGGRDGSKRVKPAKTDIVQGVASWAARAPAVLGQEGAYLRLWAARRMLRKSARAWQVGELAALMNGSSVLEASTVRQKLARLDANVSAARS